jgi:hypothetical protein
VPGIGRAPARSSRHGGAHRRTGGRGSGSQQRPWRRGWGIAGPLAGSFVCSAGNGREEGKEDQEMGGTRRKQGKGYRPAFCCQFNLGISYIAFFSYRGSLPSVRRESKEEGGSELAVSSASSASCGAHLAETDGVVARN